jgi:chromosomal replication initiator protein
MEERLVSRFNSGLVALLEQPCLETRMAIIRKKANLRCIELPEDVVRLIASEVNTNIRELEGALVTIDALSQTQGGQITLELAREALGASTQRLIKVPVILEAIASRYGVKVSELQGRKRSKAVTFPRHVCMYLARRLTSQSLEEIGGYFGGRDHSTVLHASRAITQLAEREPGLRTELDEIVSALKNVPH